MTAEMAAMAERLWLDVLRLALLGAGAAWAILLFVVILREAARTRDVGAGLRELGVTTRRPAAPRGNAGGTRPAPRDAGAPGSRGGVPEGWSADRPSRRGRWARGG